MNKDVTRSRSGRSADDRPIRTVNVPGGRTQPPATSSYRAKARAGTVSRASARSPGAALTAVNAARTRTGRPGSSAGGSR